MESDISAVAGLIADASRAKMLTALMGGKALTATELATNANITPQTASSHLNKLVNGRLLVVRKQGRHKYFQLRNSEIAELIEKLSCLSTRNHAHDIVTGPSNLSLRKSRICYDHLAGEVAVVLYDALVEQGYIIDKIGETTLTELGYEFFNNSGDDMEKMLKYKRPICKSCLDWSERRNHLSGILGQWILSDLLSKRWARKDLDSRAIHFSDSGTSLFNKKYGIRTT